jgi:PBP1b-binding outer membrane lipoprotein LpoB
MKKTLLLIFAIAFLVSCGGGTQIKDASKEKASGTWGPYEIKRTTKKMVVSLYNYLTKEWKQPTIILVKGIRNRTSEHIDTKILSDEVVTNLLQRRIQFVDEEYTADAIKEMQKGMTGLIDPKYAVPVGKLRSPNVYLYGEIRENTRYVKGKKRQYLLVTFKLQKLSTGMLLWQDRKEYLKVTKTDRISF